MAMLPKGFREHEAKEREDFHKRLSISFYRGKIWIVDSKDGCNTCYELNEFSGEQGAEYVLEIIERDLTPVLKNVIATVNSLQGDRFAGGIL